MEPKEKVKFDWTRLILTSVYVLLAALVVGGTTWYVMEQNARDVKQANDKTLAALQKQIDELKDKTIPISENSSEKTYSNTNLGISFVYPVGWSLENDTVNGPAFTFNSGSDKFGLTIMKELPGGRGYEGVTNFTSYENTKVEGNKITLGTKSSSTTPTIEGANGSSPTSGYAITTRTTNSHDGYYYLFTVTGSNAANNNQAIKDFEGLVNSIALK